MTILRVLPAVLGVAALLLTTLLWAVGAMDRLSYQPACSAAMAVASVLSLVLVVAVVASATGRLAGLAARLFPVAGALLVAAGLAVALAPVDSGSKAGVDRSVALSLGLVPTVVGVLAASGVNALRRRRSG